MRQAQTLLMDTVLMLQAQMLMQMLPVQMLLEQTLVVDFRKAQIPETTPDLVIMLEQTPALTHEKLNVILILIF